MTFRRSVSFRALWHLKNPSFAFISLLKRRSHRETKLLYAVAQHRGRFAPSSFREKHTLQISIVQDNDQLAMEQPLLSHRYSGARVCVAPTKNNSKHPDAMFF